MRCFIITSKSVMQPTPEDQFGYMYVPQLLRIKMTNHAVMICNAVSDVKDVVFIWVYERRQTPPIADCVLYEYSGNNGLFQTQALSTHALLHMSYLHHCGEDPIVPTHV